MREVDVVGVLAHASKDSKRASATRDNRQNWVSRPSISPTFWSLNVIINLYFVCYHDIIFRINTAIPLGNGRVSYK